MMAARQSTRNCVFDLRMNMHNLLACTMPQTVVAVTVVNAETRAAIAAVVHAIVSACLEKPPAIRPTCCSAGHLLPRRHKKCTLQASVETAKVSEEGNSIWEQAGTGPSKARPILGTHPAFLLRYY